MENQTQPNIPPFQPQTQTPTLPPTNWVKVLLFVIFGLAAIAGSIFIGVQIGKKQIVKQQPTTEQSNIIPTQTVANQEVISTTMEPSLTTNPTAPIPKKTDQVCKVDEDCVMAMVKCSCDCGVPINKIHWQKYLDAQVERCKNYNGPYCKVSCTFEPKCINNTCTVKL